MKDVGHLSQVFDDPYPTLDGELKPLAPTLELTAVYKLQPASSPRVLEVEKQFSLGELREEFKVFEGFRLDFNDGDVIYITGESGGGKSTLLRALKRIYEPNVVDLANIQPNPDEVLVDGLGGDVSEALYLLNNAGLGEAWLFIRRYGELSDGQKYRYRLAKALYSARKLGANALVCDEFCSTLDRITARVVAYLTQKLCRRMGLTLVAATAHEDLLEDLNPDILIVKPFQKPPLVSRFKAEPKPCSLLQEIKVEPGSFRDYFALEVYHYKGFRPAFPVKTFRAVYGGNIVGVIVYSTSYLQMKARKTVFGSHLKDMAKRKEILRISRVVVEPRLRGIGLGSRLVRETLEKTGAKIVEAIAAMAVYNPFFEKAGMRLGYIYGGNERLQRKYLAVVEKYGFDRNMIHNFNHLKKVVEAMPDDKLIEFEKELSEIDALRLVSEYISNRAMLKRGVLPRERLPVYLIQFAGLFSKLYYYYWVNPAYSAELSSPNAEGVS